MAILLYLFPSFILIKINYMHLISKWNYATHAVYKLCLFFKTIDQCFFKVNCESLPREIQWWKQVGLKPTQTNSTCPSESCSERKLSAWLLRLGLGNSDWLSSCKRRMGQIKPLLPFLAKWTVLKKEEEKIRDTALYYFSLILIA